MKPTFQKTVDILVKAYLNDTLAHGDCSACAVGNIIATSLGCKMENHEHYGLRWIRNMNEIYPCWDQVFITSCGDQSFDLANYQGYAKKQIDSTGYSLRELMSIEKAFESVGTNENDWNSDDHQYRSLMAVVDVLAEIHNVDLSVRESAKLQFVKP